MKIGLGTAQFGMQYGISNRRGKIPFDEVSAILDLAAQSGIEVLDTAPVYGDSELVLGKSLTRPHAFRVVTKVPPLPAEAVGVDVADVLRRALRQSLGNLRRDAVYGCLIHDTRALLGSEGGGLVEALGRLKQEGLAQKVGVSVYTAGEIEAVLKLFTPDIVQVPINIFDQRLLAGGHLAALKRRGVEVHGRSIFLQGLVLMSADNVADHFSPVIGHLEKFSRFIENSGLTRLEAALAFVAQVPEIDVALVGISSIGELQEIVGAVYRNAARKVQLQGVADWAIGDERIINPAMWPRSLLGEHA